jgi:two-component system sensor histidine kinase/response regulator
VLNVSALANIRALQRPGAPDLLGKVIAQYFTHAPQLLQTLREAIAKSDAGAVQQAARSLKSSSANLGAVALAALCKDLEMMGRTHALTTATTVFAEIEIAYEAAREALAHELSPTLALNRSAKHSYTL